MTVAFCMLGAATAYAADTLYKGYQTASIQLNGNDIDQSTWDVPSFEIDGHAVLPVRQLEAMMHVIVNWDSSTHTTNIYKPNVNIMLGENITQDLSLQHIFAKVSSGKTYSFFAIAQVDNLKTPVTAVRISLLDPSGNVVEKNTKTYSDNPQFQKDAFQIIHQFKASFDSTGNYVVKMEMQTSDNSNFITVGEKVIISE